LSAAESADSLGFTTALEFVVRIKSSFEIQTSSTSFTFFTVIFQLFFNEKEY